MSITMDPRRMGGVARLYGENEAERLARLHVVVVGLGGVGSWCAEALVRTGIGRLTLVDGDTVALSNTNRQLPALDGNYEKPKAEVLAERFRHINPECVVETRIAFVSEENAAEILPEDADWVIDCIDDLAGKTALVGTAAKAGLRVVSSGGAGGKRDPGRIRVDDLARAKGDPLVAKLRTNLRRQSGFPAGSASGKSKPFGIPCVYSDEPLRQPAAESVAAIGAAPGTRIGFGSGVVVTGSVGLRLASLVVNATVEATPDEESAR